MFKGLTAAEVETRAKQYGPNSIVAKKKSSLWQKFFEQMATLLTFLLVIAAIFSFYIGESIDGYLIFTVVLLNAAFGVYQEYKAEQAVSLLQKMRVSAVRVRRDNKEVEIDSRDLVPGDIFFIEEGVKIPGDAKILHSINLEVNESALTGESLPVVKGLHDEVFMGTIVSKGRAWVETTSIGMKTKFGYIAAELSSLEELKTPLQKKLDTLTEIIGLIGIIISIGIFVLSIFQGNEYFPAFLLAVSLAVALVPEGLPAVMTITLALGVRNMAQKKAIIRKMSAIESLGSVTLIATDKTGTLTENQMTVRELWVDGKNYDVHQLPHSDSKAFERLTLDGVLCSTASLVYKNDKDHFEVLGDPTEGALLKMAKTQDKEPELLKQEWILIDEVPFDSEVQRMSVTVKKNNEMVTFTKGAPEEIVRISSKILSNNKVEVLTDEKKKEIFHVLENWSKEGLRVLAFSYDPDNHINKRKYEKINQQIFIGLVAIHDPPREEVKDSLQRAFSAGIKVVMITGDNPQTAESIGKHIGLMQHGDLVLIGDQLEKYSDEELLELLPKTKIFARTTPFHKSRIVSLFQKLGEQVAVTGDGVNDAIALKQADVGIAMGRGGTDVARDAADMVITDDNFSTIVGAVEEGRNTIRNLKNSIKYLLTGNLTEGLSLLLAFALNLPPIFIPIQLLYINLISDGLPAVMLAFSPRDKDIMRSKPEKNLSLINKLTSSYIIVVATIAASFVLSSYFLSFREDLEMRKTIVFTVLVIIQPFIFMDIWFSNNSVRMNLKTLLSKYFLVGFSVPFITQFFIIVIPFLTKVFSIEQLPLNRYLVLMALSSSIFLVIKVVRKISRITK